MASAIQGKFSLQLWIRGDNKLLVLLNIIQCLNRNQYTPHHLFRNPFLCFHWMGNDSLVIFVELGHGSFFLMRKP